MQKMLEVVTMNIPRTVVVFSWLCWQTETAELGTLLCPFCVNEAWTQTSLDLSVSVRSGREQALHGLCERRKTYCHPHFLSQLRTSLVKEGGGQSWQGPKLGGGGEVYYLCNLEWKNKAFLTFGGAWECGGPHSIRVQGFHIAFMQTENFHKNWKTTAISSNSP